MIVYGDRQDLFGAILPDHILFQILHDFTRSGNLGEEAGGRSAATAFLFQYGLAQFDTFAADIDVGRAFYERADLPITFATE